MNKVTQALVILGGAALVTWIIQEITKAWQSDNNQTVTGLQTWQAVSVAGSSVAIIARLLQL